MFKGFVDVCLAFDAGSYVDLVHARRIIPESEVDALKNDPHRAIIRLTLTARSISLGSAIETGSEVLATVYCDFGGISLRYRVPFEGTLEEWVNVSVLLADNSTLKMAAHEVVSDLTRRLEPSIVRPSISQQIEDYTILCLEVPRSVGIDRLIVYEGQTITQIVNAESKPLHSDIVRNTLDGKISWFADYSAFVSWPAAVLLCDWTDEGREHIENSSFALEFVNMQLLQFEILSRQINHAMLRAYKIPETGKVSEDEQMELDELTMDCVELFGRVGSGLKIFSNVHLAHLLKTVSRKFEFQDRINEIRQKLTDLRSIRHGMLEKTRHRQSHLVEILIAGLIVIELIPMFFQILEGIASILSG